MFDKIEIKGFKSIVNDTIELGRVNVFIGENGCGKSNILEAIAYLSATITLPELSDNLLFEKGVRLAKPNLVVSSFQDIDVEKSKLNLFYKSELIENSFETNTLSFSKTGVGELLITDSEFYHLGEKPFQPKPLYKDFSSFCIFCLNTPALRGLTGLSKSQPLGIYGESLDVLLANLDESETAQLKSYSYMIDWLDDYLIDVHDMKKLQHFKLNLGQSRLYFSDKYMAKGNNVFSIENANEGILHILFYLALMISKKTPKFFAIDNIESCLNPHLARHITSEICKLAKENDKQLLITTHNPAILDGLNLHDDEIRLFEVSRNKNGHTVTRRIKVKPEHQDSEGRSLKLSELWTRGYLVAISENF